MRKITVEEIFQRASQALHHETAIVVPIYLPDSIDTGQAERLLRDTVTGLCRQVADPKMICLSVDGAESGADVAEQLSLELGATCTACAVNKGKLQAAREGVRCLLERETARYVAIIDQDGDHFAHELTNFVRAAEHICLQADTERVMILGRRVSRHRPMGFFRGELEELADRVLLDALAYHAAVSGSPLRLEYATALEEFPDFHSGYKLFSYRSACDVFLSVPQQAGTPDSCYFRHAVESVMSVEAIIRGAVLGIVNRSTLNQQPVSTFELMPRSQLVADKMIWPCRRLSIPPRFVSQWLDNHIPRLLLTTLAEGRTQIDEIREHVLTGLAGDAETNGVRTRQPLFI